MSKTTALTATQAATALVNKSKISNGTTSLSLMADALLRAAMAGLTVHLEGSPGTGKSSLIKAVADELDLYLIDIRLSTMEPTDLSGLPGFIDVPKIDANGQPLIDPITGKEQTIKRTAFVPNQLFPLAGIDTPPINPKTKQPYSGYYLFFDEIDSCNPSIQAATYKVILDRKVGDFDLHPNVAIVAAGNKESDNAVVFPMSTALRNRMLHVEFKVNVDDWVQWAESQGFDPRLVQYVRWKPDTISKFDPNNIKLNFSSCRTVEFANRILAEQPNQGAVPDDISKMLLKGALGEGKATEFIGFCKNYLELPDLNDIIKDPVNCKMPDGVSHRYALAGVLSEAMDKNNCAALITYSNRMPPEFQVMMAGDVAKKRPFLLGEQSFQKWITDNINLIN